MKKQAVAKGAKAGGLGLLVAEVRSLIQSARQEAATTVNTLQVLTNFEIGRRIVEHEQKGEKRAAYGKELLKGLSDQLTEEFGRGFSEDNLARMRKFYVTWKDRVAGFPRRLRGNPEGGSLMPHVDSLLVAPPAGQSTNPFTLSWSHYVLLLTVKDPDERNFYEIEATREGWSLPELSRQKASCLFERLALSRDKAGVKQLADKGQLLCREKKDAVVQLTLPPDANIHAREYQLYLPSKELLKQKLLEWSADEEGRV